MTSDKQIKIQMIIIVSCVIFAVLLITSLIMGLVNLATASTRKGDLEAQLNSINSQIARNDTDIAYYQTDEYIDRIAREYLNMQGADDITFVGK